MAGPITAAFRLARIEQNQVLARLGCGKIAISGVEITSVVGRPAVGRGAHRPTRRRHRLPGADEFESRRVKKRHREIARQARLFIVEPNVNGEAFDEVLAGIAVVKRARAVEQCDGRIDGWPRPIVPGHSQPRAAKLDRFLFGHGEFEGANRRRPSVQFEKHDGFAGGKSERAAPLFSLEPPAFARIGARRQVVPGATDQLENVGRRRDVRAPGANALRERNAFHELVIDVITGPVMRPRVGHFKRVLERDRRPGQVGAPGCRPGPGERIG